MTTIAYQTRAESKLSKAKIRLIMDHPFYGTLMMGLKCVFTEQIPTMATDGTSMFCNPEFVNKTPFAELVGVCVHEILHIVFKHHIRRGARNPKGWNIAGDHVINLYLLAQNVKLPKDGLADPQYRDMTTEEVYAKLPKEEQQGQGECEWGMVIDAPAPDGSDRPASDTEKQRMDSDLTVKIIQAANAAKKVGKMPGILEDVIADMLKPKVAWQVLLKDWMTAISKDDYTWFPPNRRSLWRGLVMPQREARQALGPIVILTDISASVTDEERNRFATEFNAVKELCNPEKVYVLYVDTRIAHIDVFDGDDDMEFRAVRGGGTSFDPGFDWVEENDVQPVGLIYLTDMECSINRREPEYPVMWASTVPENKVYSMPDFGQFVYMEA
jgi:predicted metal-dependent peptidase